MQMEDVSTNLRRQGGGKLSDSAMLRALECAMEEMVKSEVSDQSPYAY